MLFSQPKKVLVIDTSYLIYRSFFAYPNLTFKDEPIGALFGFCKTILMLVKKFEIEELVFALDLPVPTKRHQKYDGYKADRPEMQEIMKNQIPLILNWARQITPNVYSLEGYEADDLIFSVILNSLCEPKHFNQETFSLTEITKNCSTDYKFYVFSADRDLYQTLILDGVVFLKTHKNITTEYSKIDFEIEYELNPVQWLDYKALVGDSSDNLKGVPGVGSKTAISILQKSGSLFNLLEVMGLDNQFAKKSQFDTKNLTDLTNLLADSKMQKQLEKIRLEYNSLKETYELSALEYLPQIKLQTGIDFLAGQATFQKYGFISLLKSIQIQPKQNILTTNQETLF